MKSDPRVCTIPMTEFNHLSCADVARFERLEAMKVSSHYPWLLNQHRLLLARRVDPDRGHNKGDAQGKSLDEGRCSTPSVGSHVPSVDGL